MERVVDLIKLELVSDVFIQHQRASHVAIHKLWHICAGLETTKRCALPHTTRD